MKRKPITAAAVARNLATQLATNPDTIAKLRTFGVTSSTKKKLMFAFSTSSPDSAATLHHALRALGYGKVAAFEEDDGSITVEGWTKQMVIALPAIDAWVRRMSDLGFEHGALFEGWSTGSDT